MHIRQVDRRELDMMVRNCSSGWLAAATLQLCDLPDFPGGRILIAEEGFEPRAVLGLRLGSTCGERTGRAVISVLAVDPAHRHRGIGSLLVRFAEGIVRLQGRSCLAVDSKLEQWCEGRCWTALGYVEPGAELSKPLGPPELERCR